MADLGGSKACGHCRRVVLDGVIGFSWGCATGDGSCPISVLAQCLDRIVVGRLRLYGDVGIVRAGASRVGLDGVQAVGVGSSLDPVPGYVRVLRVIPGQGQAVVFDWGCREAGGRRRRMVLDPAG